MAMVAGITYAECLSRLGPRVEQIITGQRGGLSFFDTFLALQRLGYAVAPDWRGEYGLPRPDYKPQPIGDVNIAEVVSPVGAHVIVVLRDCSVLDPATSAPRCLDDYEVNWIAAVVPLVW